MMKSRGYQDKHFNIKIKKIISYILKDLKQVIVNFVKKFMIKIIHYIYIYNKKKIF